MINTHIERTIEGKKFYIHHGDGLAYNDTGYRILKKILRNRVAQFLYKWIHPDIGLWLAKSSSSKSRDYTSQKDYSEKDGLKDEAFKKISEGFDFVIMGHRHRPFFQKDEKGVYVNLGDWMKTFSYGVFSDGIFYFKRYYDLKGHKIIDELIADSKA